MTYTDLRPRSFHWYLAIIVNPGWVLTEEAANRAAIAQAAQKAQSPKKKQLRTRGSEALAARDQPPNVLGAISTANYYSADSAAASTSAAKVGKVGTSSSEESSSSGDEDEEKAAKSDVIGGNASLPDLLSAAERADLFERLQPDLDVHLATATAGLASATNSMVLDEKQSEPELPTGDQMEEDVREGDATVAAAAPAVPAVGQAVVDNNDTTVETLPDSQPKEDLPMELAPPVADAGAPAGTAATQVAEQAAEGIAAKPEK